MDTYIEVEGEVGEEWTYIMKNLCGFCGWEIEGEKGLGSKLLHLSAEQKIRYQWPSWTTQGLLKWKDVWCCLDADEDFLLMAEAYRWELQYSLEHDYKIKEEIHYEEQRANGKKALDFTHTKSQQNMVKPR